MGKRGLYPNLSIKSAESSLGIMDLMSASNGAKDLLRSHRISPLKIWDLQTVSNATATGHTERH